ncbi:MAG: hypothetical protein ACTSQ8_24040 [Candidatus Helarchaeota archaeon]
MNTQDDELIKRIECINNYQVTLQAIQSCISLFTWDNEKKVIDKNCFFSIGRRMTPFNNKVTTAVAKDKVTPDLVIQRNTSGYVIEVKRSLTKNSEHWDEIVDQLNKYCKQLIGWWTNDEKIDSHCVALLINMAYSYEFDEYLKSNHISFDRKFSILEFTRNDGVNEFIFIRKRPDGEIIDSNFEKYLLKGAQMPIEKIVSSYGKLKFYDAEPLVIEYIMLILWQDIFNHKRVDEGTFNPKNSRWEFIVSVDSITEELQKTYGVVSHDDREISFPKRSWIKKSLNRFVDIKFSEEIDQNKYRIFFKKIRGNVLEVLINKVVKSEIEKQNLFGQLDLFDLSN